MREIAFKSFKDFKKNIPRNFLCEEELTALENLSKDDSIVIARPDKGNGVVLMNKSEYKDKVKSILSDGSKFEMVKGEIFKKILSEEDKLNKCLRKTFNLLDENGRRPPAYYDLKASGSSLGVLYGLPKIHKRGAPIRPILSACGTPAYNLAKYLVPILSPLTKNQYTIPSTLNFAKELVDLDLSSHSSEVVFASFDVTSLFTNIPVQETIEIILNRLFQDNDFIFDNYECQSALNKCQLKELLQLASLDNHFLFDGEIYKQIDGVAMGSPLGPTLAMAFMCYMEELWLADCPLEFKPLFYKRYVDDSFLIFKSRDQIEKFLNYLNNKHSNIKFTSDIEENNALPFLETIFKHENNVISTSMYRKPTFTGLYSKYSSFTPIIYKKNLVSTLCFRAFKICSDYFALDTELNFIKTTLKLNGYPMNFIESNIKRTLDRLYVPFGSNLNLNYDVPKAIVLFPTYFLGDVSKDVAKNLNNLINKYYPQVNLRLIYKSLDTIGSRFRFKDKMPADCLSCLIYQYTCDSCNAVYIGKTAQTFKCRVFQHRGVSPRTGAILATPVQSDIREHCLKHGKQVNGDNFKIIDRSLQKSDLMILESLHQKTKKPTLGTQSQSTPLIMFD